MLRILLAAALLGCATARPRAADVVQREVDAYNAQDADAFDHEIITGRGPERPDPWDVGWVRNLVENA